MKYEIRRELKIVPAKVSVVEHKKAVYVCKNCDKNCIEANFKTAKGVSALIEKSLASPSMLAYIMNQKFTYALNQRATLEAFLENPKIELTNNSAERAIKPFVIGRKNWLFCNTPDGADSSAIIYSAIETAKANNLKPYDYLEYVFEMIRQGYDITDYLPYSKNLPQNLRIEATKDEEKHSKY